jgi:pimeloyl-ACP methyl ester carboxylesterase
VRWLLALYLLLVLLMSLNQERFIFGGHAWQGHQWTIVKPAADRELIQLKTSLGDPIYIALEKATDPLGGGVRADAASCPTMIFFYGAGGTLAGSLDVFATWRTLGLNVVGVEYPGYGMSGGQPSEKSIYSAAEAAYDYLLNRADIDHLRIISSGQSLGTGVAVELAIRRKVAAVALFSPYTSMKEMAHIDYPWLPTSLILKHHFRTEDKITQLTCPLLIAHGTKDSIIPIEMSRRLAIAAKNAQVTTVFVQTDHVDLFDHAGTEMADALRGLIARVKGDP